MKNLLSLSLLLFSVPVFAALQDFEDRSDLSSAILAIPSQGLATRNIEEKINVLHDKEGFMVADDSMITRVNTYDVAPMLRNMDPEKAAKVLSATKLKVTKLSNGEFLIDPHGELNGGGTVGAAIGFWVGKGTVYILGHGAIIAAGIGSGPWGFTATVASLEAQFAAPIEAASNQVALAAGLALGVATGPTP